MSPHISPSAARRGEFVGRGKMQVFADDNAAAGASGADSGPAAISPVASGERRVCAVIPVYNHAETVWRIVAETLSYLPHVLVVDDGSTDADVGELLAGLPVMLYRHAVNRGKGAALRTALTLLHRMGFHYMLTLDADGQHDPGDIPAFLSLAARRENILAVGCRDFRGKPVPDGAKFGRRLSNLLLRLECGARSGDCQSGFRLYPVNLLSGLQFRSGHYDFEAEVLALAGWAGAEFHDLPIHVFYPSPEQRITHFRPWPELMRLTLLHLRLLRRGVFRR